jgi:flagellar protein FlaG
MASETFVSAMLLVTGVVAAAILIVAVLPVIWSMVGTFGSASAATDRSMRTDFKIVTTYSKYWGAPGTNGANVSVWMKNTGTARFGKSEIESADVYVGKSSDFTRAIINSPATSSLLRPTATRWWYNLANGDLNANNIWDPGETLEVGAFFYWNTAPLSLSGQPIYFQFTLPNSVSRSTEMIAV